MIALLVSTTWAVRDPMPSVGGWRRDSRILAVWLVRSWSKNAKQKSLLVFASVVGKPHVMFNSSWPMRESWLVVVLHIICVVLTIAFAARRPPDAFRSSLLRPPRSRTQREAATAASRSGLQVLRRALLHVLRGRRAGLHALGGSAHLLGLELQRAAGVSPSATSHTAFHMQSVEPRPGGHDANAIANDPSFFCPSVRQCRQWSANDANE